MLGIDVSKATLVTTLLDGVSLRRCWEVTVPNTEAGVRSLLARTAVECPWVLEPTGAYSAPVARSAQAAGRTVLVAPPRRATAVLASVQPRTKTDRLDSAGLARSALAVPVRPSPVKDAAMAELDQRLAARRGLSRRLAQLRQQRTALPLAADALDRAIGALATELTALDRQIAARRPHAAPAAEALLRVPGIGPVTAAAVGACLQRIPFAHPDQFVASIGLDVRVRDSGSRRGRRALSKQGDAELRRLLYLCAQANLRSRDATNPFKLQYDRECAKGLPTTGALNAVARTRARTCWSLHRHGSTYDPLRVRSQPPSRSSSNRTVDAQP